MMEDMRTRFESLRRRFDPKSEFRKEEEIGPLPPLE
jgi:hypothetical protein